MSEHPPAQPSTAQPTPAQLTAAVDRLADRFRAMPQSRLLGAVPGHRSRAAAALALARRFAEVGRALEGLAPLDVPDAGAFAVGDQIAVTGHDLAAAAAGHPEQLAAALADLERTETAVA